MIITPKAKPQIIPIEPKVTAPEDTPAPMSLVQQDAYVFENRELSAIELEIQNLNNKTTRQIRANAENALRAHKLEGFQSLLQTEQDSELLAGALGQLSKVYIQNKVALEQMVVDKLQQEAQESPVAAFIREQDIPLSQALGERIVRDMVVQNKITELYDSADMGDHALNFVNEFNFLNFLQRSFGFGFTDYGSELRAISKEIENVPIEELPDFLDSKADLIRSTQYLGDNPAFVAEVFALAADGSIGEQDFETFLNLADLGINLFEAGQAAKTVRTARGLTKAAIESGNTEKLGEDLVEGTGRLSDPNDPSQTNLYLGLKTEFDEATNLSSKVQQAYYRAQRMLQAAIDGNRGPSFEDAEGVLDTSSLSRKIRDSFDNGSIISQTRKEDDVTEVILVQPQGAKYSTKEGASVALKERGFQGAVVHEFPEGGFGIKIDMDTNTVKDANLSSQGISRYRRWLGRVESWLDRNLLTAAQGAEGSLNFGIKQAQKVYRDTIGPLKGKEKERLLPILEQIRVHGDTHNEWMPLNDVINEYRRLYGEAPSERELTALGGFRLLDQFAYNLDNSVLRSRLESQGYGTVYEGLGGKVEARFVDEIPKGEYVYVKGSDQVIPKKDTWEGFLDEYDILYVNRIDDIEDASGKLRSSPTHYIAVPKDSVKIDTLRPNPLPYKAGGRKRYDDTTVWLKQTNKGTRPDGKTYARADRTLFAATSFPQAVREAAKINHLNGILRRGIDEPAVIKEAQAYLSKNLVLGTDDIGIYMSRIEERNMDIFEEVRPLRNRETIPLKTMADNAVDDVEMETLFSGRLGRRGSEVPNIDPDAEHLLNPLQSLNNNLTAAINSRSFAAYREYVMNYMERYRPFLNVTKNSPRINLLDAEINPQFASSLSEGFIRRIKGEQRFIREVIGKLTPEEISAIQTTEKFVEAALDRVPPLIISGTQKNKLVAKGSEFIGQDVMGRLRGLVFNAKLGLFSLPAMAIQMAHAPIIATMSPVHGLKSMLTYPVLRIGLVSRDPLIVKELAKKSEALGLKGFGDLEKFFNEFRYHGFDSFGSNLIYENAARGDNVITGAASRIAEKGRVFFEEGELVPRMTGYGVAVREWLSDAKLNPKKLPIDSEEGRRYIVARTNTLTLGMTRADLQQGMKTGVLGLAAQFQSYPLRALDALVFPSQGLSKGERARMALGYLMMYGAAGLPLTEQLADYASERGWIGDSKTAYKFVYNGIVDGFAMAIFGENTNFASRGGLGDWLKELINGFKDKKFVETLLGPAGSTVGGAMDTVIQYQRAWSANFNPDPSQITSNTIMDIAKQVSSFNNLYRTWVAVQTGKIYDSRGNQFIDISSTGALLQLFGLPPQAYADTGAIFKSKEKRKLVIQMNTEFMVKAHLDFASAVRNNDIEEMKQIKARINGMRVYIDLDGLTQEVDAAVASELSGNSTYQQLIQDSLLQHNLGEKGILPKEIEVLQNGN